MCSQLYGNIAAYFSSNSSKISYFPVFPTLPKFGVFPRTVITGNYHWEFPPPVYFRVIFFFMSKMVHCVYSLESPRRGNSNENTQYTFMLKKIEKNIPIMPPDLALLSTLIGLNYPYLELIFMVQKVFEPLKFYCIYSGLYLPSKKQEIS